MDNGEVVSSWAITTSQIFRQQSGGKSCILRLQLRNEFVLSSIYLGYEGQQFSLTLVENLASGMTCLMNSQYASFILHEVKSTKWKHFAAVVDLRSLSRWQPGPEELDPHYLIKTCTPRATTLGIVFRIEILKIINVFVRIQQDFLV